MVSLEAIHVTNFAVLAFGRIFDESDQMANIRLHPQISSQ
jgi:hypothetical protein